MITVVLVVIIIVGLVLALSGTQQRRTAGFGPGHTISHDDVTLRSPRLGLVGKPDRIVRLGNVYIPEEYKSGEQAFKNYRAQMGVYLLLVEETYGVRPPYGVLVLGKRGKRVKVRNTSKLRQWVLQIAQDIRRHRQMMSSPLPPADNPAKCRPCSQRENCSQRRV